MAITFNNAVETGGKYYTLLQAGSSSSSAGYGPPERLLVWQIVSEQWQAINFFLLNDPPCFAPSVAFCNPDTVLVLGLVPWHLGKIPPFRIPGNEVESNLSTTRIALGTRQEGCGGHFEFNLERPRAESARLLLALLCLAFPSFPSNQVYQNVKGHNVQVKECKTISKGQWKTIFKLYSSSAQDDSRGFFLSHSCGRFFEGMAQIRVKKVIAGSKLSQATFRI